MQKPLGHYTSATSAAEDMLTCQQVIDAKDSPSMQEMTAALREASFKLAATAEAQNLYQELEEKGINRPLGAVLSMYESTYIPVRDGAHRAWTAIVDKKGGEAATFAALCPKRDLTVVAFYQSTLESFQRWNATNAP